MKSKEVQEEKVSPWRNQSVPSGGSLQLNASRFWLCGPVSGWGSEGVVRHNNLHPLGPQGAPSTLSSVQPASGNTEQGLSSWEGQ